MGNILYHDDPNYKDVRGQILLMDTTMDKPKVISLPIEGDFDLKSFRPHGISLWKDPKSGRFI